ncbi:hypothetical protein Taro_003131 [Colocasia esculenta]|uniref:Uncharacterized protein n=1 Tax=Colocasia esculenta TaxID=4460 RepID=A0A843TMV5_COLES|nr:hypothetical protein [Colocasia esculenta]
MWEDTKYVLANVVFLDEMRVPTLLIVTYSMGSLASIWEVGGTTAWSSAWRGDYHLRGLDLAYLQMKAIASSVLLHNRLEFVPGHNIE